MTENGSRPPIPAGSSTAAEQPPATDPEVVGNATMRRYSKGFKRRILREVELAPPGEVGAILRREGLYYSTLRHFRQQQEEGLLDANSRQRPRSPSSRCAQQERLAQLTGENQALKQQLKQAQVVLEIQKKACELLNLPFQSLEESGS